MAELYRLATHDAILTGGVFVQLVAPDDPLTLNAFTLIRSKVHLTGSYIGSRKDIREMFELAAAKKIEPWVQLRPMQGANEAIMDMENGLARYRYVLTNEGFEERH